MEELSGHTDILITFSFILTVLGFACNIILSDSARESKYFMHLGDSNGLIKPSFLTSHNFTVDVFIGRSGNADVKASLYVLVGGAQSDINESKNNITFSSFTKALSRSLYLSPSETLSLCFHFFIDGKNKALLISSGSQRAAIDLEEVDTLRIAFVVTSSEVFDQGTISIDSSESAWVSVWWKAP
jgi:hypothetical protein